MTIKYTRLAMLLSALCLCVSAPALAQAPAAPGQGVSAEKRALASVSQTLGWPDTITTRRLIQSLGDEDSIWALWPLDRASTLLLTTRSSVDNGGSTDEHTLQYAAVLPVGRSGADAYIDKLVDNGLKRGTYQGRPAAKLRAGDEICETRGLMEFVRRAVNQAISKVLFGIDTSDNCLTVDSGYLAWSCGDHVFVASDRTGQGAETRIGAALHSAANQEGLCAVGDTLVILAQTGELAGTRDVFHFQLLAEGVSAYYEKNAYGNVSFAYTFLDQDGATGSSDWFNIADNQADYRGREAAYVRAAVQSAFAEKQPGQDLRFERIIAVHPGNARQSIGDRSSAGTLETLAQWPGAGGWHEITVGAPGAQSTVYARVLILVSENDPLGTWTHEVAHSLQSRHLVGGQNPYLDDRYNSQRPTSQNGDISAWGLMGAGNWWGIPQGTAPVHMIGFTKEAAGWIGHSPAVLGEQQRLSALETTSVGSTLKIDDPTSADPESYMLLEARQSSGAFGAPESGVVAYLVSYDRQNGHHVVNNMHPPSGPTRGSGAALLGYERATLRDAGAADGVTQAAITPWRLLVTLHDEGTDDAYWATVSTSEYNPTSLVGAAVAPVATRDSGLTTATINDPGPLPDIDLHAWDDQGRHVGINYASLEYERQIPGAEASGDLRGDEEWIFVPEGTQVRYVVNAEKTRQFLGAHPEWAEELAQQKYTISYCGFDAQSVQTVADGGEGVVPPGIESPLSSPYDPSLEYKPAAAWHYGRNWPPNLPL
ncbi:MAG: hypothetical protein R6X16_07835, partial [Anaerolineae bacterium]